jgi:hypothetical protein
VLSAPLGSLLPDRLGVSSTHAFPGARVSHGNLAASPHRIPCGDSGEGIERSNVGLVVRQTVFDCLNPSAVAAFWGEVLGWEVKQEETYLWMSDSGADESFGVVLVFVRVPEPKAVKNRVHLDLAVRRSDQATEVARLLNLGAVPVDIGQEERPWVVLADPEGNEFCVEPINIE